ncbi:MAG: hypothetical protein Q8Q35_02275, partial [Nanoarchaeota archaeon]|nr:hypothetical protein [Nanoarchaeota archaeon]
MGDIKRDIFKFFIIIFIISLFLFSVYALGGGTTEDVNEGEKAHDIYIEPSLIPEDTGVTYTASTEEEPATFDISKTTEPLEVKSFEGTVITDQGEVSGTFNNFVIGNGGFYEATITGVAAGTTMYFLSYFDDQIFKFTAGEEETEVRVIQFQTNGSSQERIYIELATGDIIDQGSLFDEQDYHFYAYDDASIYIYNADQTTEITEGEYSYTGEYTESFEAFEDS